MNDAKQTSTDKYHTEKARPLLSVICIVYNHGKYLRECFDGILKQKTSFPIEIIVHDDASADNSQEIIREYEKKFPHIFKSILQTKNQLGVIGGRIVLNAFAKTSGDYIAYCDGDDRWTDPLKLSFQVDYLNQNPDCAGCFHRSRIIDSLGNVLHEDCFVPSLEKYKTSDCISRLASEYSTSSLVFQRKALESPPVWLQKNFTDLFLEFQISRFGKIGFVDRNMTDYRRHDGGIWSGRSMPAQMVELIHRYKSLLEEPEFAEDHADALNARISEYTSMLRFDNGCPQQVNTEKTNNDYETLLKSKWVQLGQALKFCPKP